MVQYTKQIDGAQKQNRGLEKHFLTAEQHLKKCRMLKNKAFLCERPHRLLNKLTGLFNGIKNIFTSKAILIHLILLSGTIT